MIVRFEEPMLWSKPRGTCEDVGKQTDVVQRGYGVGWDRKKRGASRGYYYRSVRDGAVVRKIYLGKSTAAEEAAAAVARRRNQRHTGALALRTEAESTVEADRHANELRNWAEVIASAWLMATGHHLHHGCWRRPMTKRAPRVGSKAWFEARNKDPEYIKSMIESLSRGAARGERGAAENLAKWLAAYPQYRSLVPQLRDLTDKVEGIWIQMVSGTDKVAGQATAEEVAKLKTELLASVVGGGGILEKLMASTIAVNYLVHQHAAARLADRTEHLTLAAYREHRMTAAQKRLHGTMKMWARIVEAKAKGIKPPTTVGFFADESQERAAAPKPPDDSSSRAAPKSAGDSSSRPSHEPTRRPRSASRKRSAGGCSHA